MQDFQVAYNIVKNHFPDETIDYMESFKALLTNAQGVILAHNHPSENIQPSGQFKRIFQGGALITHCRGIIKTSPATSSFGCRACPTYLSLNFIYPSFAPWHNSCKHSSALGLSSGKKLFHLCKQVSQLKVQVFQLFSSRQSSLCLSLHLCRATVSRRAVKPGLPDSRILVF